MTDPAPIRADLYIHGDVFGDATVWAHDTTADLWWVAEADGDEAGWSRGHAPNRAELTPLGTAELRRAAMASR
ncbi:hypothetical protein MXD62_19600 [Frankia sp. Mgl5]|uniref:hypothetical protein n=1 Tax=Frankia sp. Mgl5 TaxID=2933793 RepID=UPI00200FBD93|nr:hypothetical protein [Frankia sp. Mgl5]MCK9929358.1 hypothetical protein [Frankia sp. Mgl5]